MSMIGHFTKLSAAQLEKFIAEPQLAVDFVFPDDGSYPEPPIALDIDKSWHLIHFLLAGETWGGEGPLAAAVLGGSELAETDTGYGPLRYLLPEEVRAVAESLKTIRAADLWNKFDAASADAAEIYPSGWTNDDFEYIGGNYEQLRQFYSEAAADRQALLLYIA